MAAKQGLTAHISQASEDAKRAVLSRAPSAIKSHSWLSNLNTTCTIKSAPPRTPEVMTLLSVKSGWLVKRNEQHVWQRRWCCVVPHMMLYYFEAEPARSDDDSEDIYATTEGFSGGGLYRSDVTLVENQDTLNAAVRDGLHGKPIAISRHGTPLRGRDGEPLPLSPASDKKGAAPIRGPTTTSGNLSPVGIIDLECYSCVNRSSVHDCVFELTGDSVTNPDLRSFFFQAGDVEDSESWTNALISDRHSALRDEREAYRQVCDSFQLQLQNMSDMIDSAEGKAAEADRQLYSVRSQAEKSRTETSNIVREAIEQKCWGNLKSSKNMSDGDKIIQHLEMERLAFLDKFHEILSSADAVRSSSKNNSALVVQLLADYFATVAGSYTDLNQQLTSAKQKLNQSANVEQATVADLKLKIERLEADREEEVSRNEGKIVGMELQLHEAQRLNEQLQNQLDSQRMEFTMFQSQAKAKLQELSSHKKILKKEVIELRKKVEAAAIERDAALHISDSHKVHADNANEKNTVLESYIEKIENQVKIQQDMMEMISLSGMSRGGGSVVGRIIGSSDDNSYSSLGHMMKERPNHYLRQASPMRLPPRSRLPPDGQPPLSSISKKGISDVSSPISPPSPKRQIAFPDSDGNDDPSFGRTSRGTLDGQLIHNDVTPTRHHRVSENDNSHTNDNDRLSKYQEALNESKKKIEKYHQTSETKNQLSESAHCNHDDDNDDDDKSHKSNVSELTEDRTQRAFDAAAPRNGIHYTMSDMTGENVVADAGVNAVKYEKASTGAKKGDYPPRFIIGAHDESSTTDKDDVKDCHVALETKPVGVSMNTNSGNMTSISSSKSVSTYLSGNDIKGTKLSVAQRARLAAENPKKIDIAPHDVTNQSLTLKEAQDGQKKKEIGDQKSIAITPKKIRTRTPSPGVFSNLGKRVVSALDKSIIGVKVPGDDATPKVVNSRDILDPQVVEETSLSLAERQKLQRERQIRLLRQKGLIDENGARTNSRPRP